MSQFFLITPAESWLAFVVGALLFLTGAILLLVVVRQWIDARDDEPEQSLLAPVLAVDTLAPDLRVLWVKTLLLEAEARAPHRIDAARLARELRRCLLAGQAARVEKGEAVEETDALVNGVAERLSEALRALRGGSVPDFGEMIEGLRKERTALDEDAEGR